jgi:tetratricopeptide (TPR) repeat protein
MFEGDHADAARHYEEAMAIWRELGDDRGLCVIAQNLAIARDAIGDRARAIELLEESARLARRAAQPPHLASALQTLSRLVYEDDADRAIELLRESLTLARDLHDQPGIEACLESLAAVAGRRGAARTGAQLIGATATARTARGAVRQAEDAAFVAEAVATLRGALGDEAYAGAVREGGSLDLDEAIARALAIAG